jgi:hypothetical protein
MDHGSFDRLTLRLGRLRSRRAMVGGLGVLSLPGLVDARKKRKKKKKKVKFNDFGCVSVGGFCKNAEHCCSGICNGNKGKRTCRAHDVGTCRQEVPAVCQSGTPINTPCNNRQDCRCVRTTSGSSYCAEVFCEAEGCSACVDCRRDADCVALGFPSESVCASLSEGLCAGICKSGSGMACLLPCGPEPPAPSE